MATKSAKKSTATKNTKKADTVDFSKSINTITDTAKNVNKQVMKATETVAEDIVKQGNLIKEVAVKTVKKQSDMAIKTVKKTYANVAEVITVENVKKTAKNTNAAALKTADGLVDSMVKGSEQWQGVAAKAVKGGIKLADKQQDIVFTALEAMKGQVLKGANRFGRLFSRN